MIFPDIADKFLYRALVLVNAYQNTKFQLSSSVSFRDTTTASTSRDKFGKLTMLRSLSTHKSFNVRGA